MSRVLITEGCDDARLALIDACERQAVCTADLEALRRALELKPSKVQP